MDVDLAEEQLVEVTLANGEQIAFSLKSEEVARLELKDPVMVEELERLCSDYKQSQVELGISEEITGTEVYANGNSTDDDDDDIRVRQIIEWPSAATFLFLKMYGPAYKEFKSPRRIKIPWSQIMDSLRQEGFDYSIDAGKAKLKSLKSKYFRIRKERKDRPKSWEHYYDMDSIFGGDIYVEPSIITIIPEDPELSDSDTETPMQEYSELEKLLLKKQLERTRMCNKKDMDVIEVSAELVRPKGTPHMKFINRYLKNVPGHYTHKRVHQRTVMMYCERKNNSVSKKRTAANQTRANGCTAYVSFRFEMMAGKETVIIRKKMDHLNHDINNLEEKTVAKIHPHLKRFMIDLSKQGVSVSKIQLMCEEWSKSKNRHDRRDRRYYPTRKDVTAYTKLARRKDVKVNHHKNPKLPHIPPPAPSAIQTAPPMVEIEENGVEDISIQITQNPSTESFTEPMVELIATEFPQTQSWTTTVADPNMSLQELEQEQFRKLTAVHEHYTHNRPNTAGNIYKYTAVIDALYSAMFNKES